MFLRKNRPEGMSVPVGKSYARREPGMLLKNAEPRRWTADEYMRLFDRGILSHDEHLELIDGHIVLMAAHNQPHMRGMGRCNNALVMAYGTTHYVVPASSLRVDDWSVPEPDFTLVPRTVIDETDEVWRSGDLLVEVADASLPFDRHEKASLYARAGIAEYWILDMRHRKLMVHRAPGRMRRMAFGWGYREVVTLHAEDVVQALMRPDVALRVGDLM